MPEARTEKHQENTDSTKDITTLKGSVQQVWCAKNFSDESHNTQAELGRLAAEPATGIRYQKKMACHNNDAEKIRACIRATTQIAEFVVELPSEAKKHYLQNRMRISG